VKTSVEDNGYDEKVKFFCASIYLFICKYLGPAGHPVMAQIMECYMNTLWRETISYYVHTQTIK
jgi:hypothetical protein